MNAQAEADARSLAMAAFDDAARMRRHLAVIVRESDRAGECARLDRGTGDVIVPIEAWRRARAAVLAAAHEYGIEQEEEGL